LSAALKPAEIDQFDLINNRPPLEMYRIRWIDVKKERKQMNVVQVANKALTLVSDVTDGMGGI